MSNNKLGPTGDFPDGKLSENDKGALNFAIGQDHGFVAMAFGADICGLWLEPQDAVRVALALIQKAREVAKATGKPLKVPPWTVQ